MKKIIIGIQDNDGRILNDSIQLFSDWENNKFNPNILKLKCGEKLFDIITNDLNFCKINVSQKLEFNFTKPYNDEALIMRLMGSIAEAIVVRRCNEDPEINKLYVCIARKGKRIVSASDKYIAIGTGHHCTKLKYPTKYNPLDTQKDIIWIHKENQLQELMEVGSTQQSGNVAALQIKASNLGNTYIANEITSQKYDKPIVYFGMKDNYMKIQNRLLDYGAGKKYRKFYNIRDIDEEAYREFIEYKALIKKLINKEMELTELIKTKDRLLNQSNFKSVASLITNSKQLHL